MTVVADRKTEDCDLYDSGHESMEGVERTDIAKPTTEKNGYIMGKDVMAEEDEDEVDEGADEFVQEGLDEHECSHVTDSEPEHANMEYQYPLQKLPYNDLVAVLERTTNSSSRMDVNHLNPNDALIRSTTFSIRPESYLSVESLARPRHAGLLRKALTLSHASGLAQAGGEYHLGSLADVYHSIQNLRNVKKVEHPSEELPDKKTILRNYVYVCIGHLLMMMGFLPLRAMQTSLNHKDNLGSITISAQLSCYVVGALLTPVVIPKLGIKWTLTSTMFLTILFILGNVYSSIWTLLPTGMIVGISLSILYSTQATYQTGMAYAYSVLTNEPINQVLPLFVAAYLSVVQFANVLGNLFTSTILKFLTPVFTSNESVVLGIINISNTKQCGASFCNSFLDTDSRNSDVSRPVLYILLCILGLMILLGGLFASFGMDRDLDRLFVKPNSEDRCCAGSQWRGWLELHKDIRMLLILVLASFTTFMPSFIFSDTMKAYITCPLGMEMLGYVIVCYGVSNGVTTALTGPLARRIGWTNILYLGFAFTIIIFVAKIFWQPGPDDTVYIFLLFGLCGAVDPMYLSPCYGIIGVMFNDRAEHAFSLLIVYQALVSSAAYGLSPFMCMTNKLYLSLVYLAVTVVAYTALEVIVRRQKNVKMDLEGVAV